MILVLALHRSDTHCKPWSPAMKIKELMKRSPTTIQVDDDLTTARDLMVWMGIRHLPVLDGGKLIGILSESDVAAFQARTGTSPRTMSGHPVEEAMHTPVETSTPEESVDEAAQRMAARRINCLPVVEGGDLVGLVTASDILANQVRLAPANEARPLGPMVAEAMTRDPQVVHAGDHLLDAAGRMQAMSVRHLTVTDGDGKVIGMLSDSDVRTAVGNPQRVVGGEAAEVQLELLLVRDVMSSPAITVRPDERCADVARYFAGTNVGAMPVVDADNRILGICSYIDILRALSAGR
jgi:CBS domain-containing protein